MSDIHELNRKRIEGRAYVDGLGMMNTPKDYDKRLAADSRYAFAMDALQADEAEYRKAMAGMSADQLRELAGIG